MSHYKKLLYLFISIMLIINVYGLSTSNVGNINIAGIINQTNSSLISVFAGNVTVQAISGDGSGLTGITSEANISAGTGINITGSTISIYGPYRLPQICSNGDLTAWNSTSSDWSTCTSVTGGDITSVIAGTGILGGGTTGDVTLNVSSDTCTGSEFNRYNGTHFICDTPSGSGDITAVNTNDKYLNGGSNSGEVNLTLNESELNITIDLRDTDTTYTNGTGLSLIGTTFSLLWQSLSLFINDVDFIDSTFGNATYILQSDESNLSVNHSDSTDKWDLLDTPTDITTLGTLNATSIDSLSLFKNNLEVATLNDLTGEGSNITVTTVLLIRNNESTSVTPGTPMKFIGYNDTTNITLADKAYNNETNTHADCVVFETITSGNTGQCVVSGIITNADTSGFSSLDELYLSSTSGELTATKPLSANCIQRVAQALNSNSTNGVMWINGAGRCNDVSKDINITGNITANKINADDWTNVSILENQISNLQSYILQSEEINLDVNNSLTCNLAVESSEMNWTGNKNYPGACVSGTAVTEIGDSNTCTAFVADDIDPGTFPVGNYIFQNNVTVNENIYVGDLTSTKVRIGTNQDIISFAKFLMASETNTLSDFGNVLFMDTALGHPAFFLGKSRGNESSQTIVEAGDKVGALVWNCHDGTDLNTNCAQIYTKVIGTPTSNDVDADIYFDPNNAEVKFLSNMNLLNNDIYNVTNINVTKVNADDWTNISITNNQISDGIGVTSVTGTSPIVSSEGTTPAISATILKDIITTTPLTIDGGASLNDVLLGTDSDVTFAIIVLKDIVASGTGMSGGADDVLTGTDSDVTITLTTNKDLVAGDGMTGGENDVFPGADADVTITMGTPTTLTSTTSNSASGTTHEHEIDESGFSIAASQVTAGTLGSGNYVVDGTINVTTYAIGGCSETWNGTCSIKICPTTQFIQC